MRTAQAGDRVRVHYHLRTQDGSERSSEGHAPLEVTVGVPHPRLPGLGVALAGMAPGTRKSLWLSAEEAYGLPDPVWLRHFLRERFPAGVTLRVGRQVRCVSGRGRTRLVRVVRVGSRGVLVDANHRWAGQTVELEVELVGILSAGAVGGAEGARGQHLPGYLPTRSLTGHTNSGKALRGGGGLPRQGRAIAFNTDAASLATVRAALPGWQVDAVHDVTVAALSGDWDPGAVDLLVVGPGAEVAETLGLCRFLAFSSLYSSDFRQGQGGAGRRRGGPRRRTRRMTAPLLVLVGPEQGTLIGAALEAGAHSCLMLPVTAADVSAMLARARAGGQPGRHTRNTERPQPVDDWQDEGGQG